mgnify:CR=1 FL=1|tara:strand:- start:252 stop:1100 length:849 start_codon:yes stop_codon:yes gene_type:complete
MLKNLIKDKVKIFRNLIKKITRKSLKTLLPENYLAKLGYNPKDFGLIDYTFPKGDSVLEDIESKYGGSSELGKLFASHKGCLIHKWHHYLPIYERYFASFKNKKNLKFLEIGVSKGGSLQLWRNYFGDSATIFGIDIDPNCKQYDGLHGKVRIGSQNDKGFLESVVNEMGGVDVVLDDGSHQMRHIKKSLDILFPHLSENGIYFIEDLHTSYWKSHGGGYNSKDNFFNDTIIDIVNDLHRWYHMHSIKKPNISEFCSAIHIYDSIIILEKSQTFKPMVSKIS